MEEHRTRAEEGFAAMRNDELMQRKQMASITSHSTHRKPCHCRNFPRVAHSTCDNCGSTTWVFTLSEEVESVFILIYGQRMKLREAVKKLEVVC